MSFATSVLKGFMYGALIGGGASLASNINEPHYALLGSIFGIWLGSYLVKNNFINEKILYRTITVFLLISSIYFYYEHWN